MNAPLRDELIWGCEAIAQELGRSRRQVYHLLEGGLLPVARKVGGGWVVSRTQLRAFFAGEAEAVSSQ